MDLALPLARYAHALGRGQAAWRFAPPVLRRAIALAQISAAWDVFRRDAGPGEVGPAREDASDTGVARTDDPRRDGVLLWLADRGSGAIAEAAGLLARMVGATRRLGAADQELLQVARDALADGGRGPITRSLPPPVADADDPLASLRGIAGAVDRLRGDPAFLESAGGEVRHRLPAGTVGHYVPAAPGGAWALNLALLADGSAATAPGLVGRALFRPLAEPEECAIVLVDGATAALTASYRQVGQLQAELERGAAALSRMSRNARAREAWRLVAALRSVTRAQLGRALGLSRAGADIQARALADAGMVTLAAGGWLVWTPAQSAHAGPDRFDQGPLGDAVSDLDASMAEIDRLLARTVARGA